MHSWRVLFLPFIDQAPLYRSYRFDEPWDGPNNRKLADKALAVYNCPSDDHGGTGSPSDNDELRRHRRSRDGMARERHVAVSDISDGAANTLLVVEIANSGIHWMEPRDLHLVQMAPTINPKSGQGISSRHTGERKRPGC